MKIKLLIAFISFYFPRSVGWLGSDLFTPIVPLFTEQQKVMHQARSRICYVMQHHHTTCPIFIYYILFQIGLQYFDAVGWATGRASGL